MNAKYKIIVLLYHQFGISPTSETNLNCFCKEKEFYNQMKFLSNSRDYNVISLDKAINIILTAKNIDRNYVVLTFDDGCESFYNIAYPIIKSFGFEAIVYPIAGFLGKKAIINNKEYNHLKIMSESMIKQLNKDGLTIGAHTLRHLKLTEISYIDAKFQILNSKLYLENILGTQISSFSYPHGKYNDSIIQIVKNAGFSNAVTCNSAFFKNSSTLYEIPRTYITFNDDLSSFIDKIT